MKTVVGAGLAMVLLASQASAECAWVLWRNTLITSMDSVYQNRQITPEVVFSQLEECESTATRLMATSGGETKTTDSFGVRLTRVVFICFPDTIDPRGAAAPKGK